ncbi:MAG TPA: VWA domain-containing protein [Bryobacteraceae bacterium]|nr:VWA domain-containing protein [Bryobacteraceae bacterium]
MKTLLAALLFFCAGEALLAQQPAPPQPAQPTKAQASDDDTRISVDVTRVNVLFTVTDKKGRFITNLDRADFEILENKRSQNIMEFTAETDLPLRMAILVDTSNSIRDRFRFIQEAAVEFINSVMRPEADRALVVSFDTQTQLVSDLEASTDKLAEKIRELRPGGGTSLYDAIFYACRDKLAMDQPKHKFRRAMVILSDGEDTQSSMSRDQALEMAQKSDVVIYTISTNISRLETDGDRILRYLAAETGGLAFFPFKVEDLSQSFENIANELRHQYNLYYRPEPLKTDGSYQVLNVKVKGRKDLVVRARKGYYAPKM